MAERNIQNDIREALGQEPDLVIFRNNTGVFDDGRGGKVRTGLGVGSADLVGILTVRTIPIAPAVTVVAGVPIGRFFAFEVKAEHGRVSPEQERWLALVRRMGGFAAVVRSAEEAKQALTRARRGESQ